MLAYVGHRSQDSGSGVYPKLLYRVDNCVPDGQLPIYFSPKVVSKAVYTEHTRSQDPPICICFMYSMLNIFSIYITFIFTLMYSLFIVCLIHVFL